MREPGKLFVFGLGYVGLRLGIAAQNAGYDVCGTVRSEEKAAAIAQATGIAYTRSIWMILIAAFHWADLRLWPKQPIWS